jgi:hypothetical protein
LRDNARFICNVVLHLKAGDLKRDIRSGQPNHTALRRVWKLPNLKNLDILMGDSEMGWALIPASFQRMVESLKSLFPEE